jgi:hypothetical protein
MPRKTKKIKYGTSLFLRNVSFEYLVKFWLTFGGWEVVTHSWDNSHKTDLAVLDGERFYRLQIKTIDGNRSEDQAVRNSWSGSDVHYIIFVARNSDWGFITPAFSEESRPLNHDGHIKFLTNRYDFNVAFKKIP